MSSNPGFGAILCHQSRTMNGDFIAFLYKDSVSTTPTNSKHCYYVFVMFGNHEGRSADCQPTWVVPESGKAVNGSVSECE
jgi:hypothetical protein